MADTHFLDNLLETFTGWCHARETCRALVLVGSAARSKRPADEYSDRDVLLFVTDLDSPDYLAWMRQYAPIWMVIDHKQTPNKLWGIIFQGGHGIHLSVDSVGALQKIVDTQELEVDQWRGYKTLLDKDGLAMQMPPASLPPYQPPSEQDFMVCVESFMYGTLLLAKDIRRGNLWTVKSDNAVEQGFLLKMIEWHARARDGSDTWHRGEAMHTWTDADTWQQLHGCFGRFDAEDSWQALFASLELFQRLAKDVADWLGYPFPQAMIDEIDEYLHGVYSK